MYQDLLDETPPANHANESAAEALAASAPPDDSHEAAASAALARADDDTNSGNVTDTNKASDTEGEAATTIGEVGDASTDDAEATDHGEASAEATNTGHTGPVDGADFVSDVDVPQTPTAIAATPKAELDAVSELTVEIVEEVEGAKPAVDKRRALLRAQGLSDDVIDKILPVMAVTRKTQRQLPVDSTVCSPEMIAFFEGRDEGEVTADCVKGIRNDGGPYGPAGMYERTLVKLGVDAVTAKTAGEVLADKVNHRIVAIRFNVVATINELRRRRAVADGLNPRAEKYLRVR